MSVFLCILGFLVAVIGTAMIGFGVPIIEFTLGTTLIIAGTTVLTSGLILMGLAAVVAELSRVAEGLKTRVPARTAATPEPAGPGAAAMAYPATPTAAQGGRPVPAMPPPAPPPRPRPEGRQSDPAGTSAVEVSAAAIERLRSSIPRQGDAPAAGGYDEVPLSPNGAGHQPRPPGVELARPEPRIAAEDRAGGADAAKKSRLDFLFRSKSGRPASPAENLDVASPNVRPQRNLPEPAAPSRHDQIERQSEPAEENRGVAILKSGVVDGMAYTLYADGSIEAKLPHGTVRFGSIAELRSHIEHNS
jgi:hypothetical protein